MEKTSRNSFAPLLRAASLCAAAAAFVIILAGFRRTHSVAEIKNFFFFLNFALAGFIFFAYRLNSKKFFYKEELRYLWPLLVWAGWYVIACFYSPFKLNSAADFVLMLCAHLLPVIYCCTFEKDAVGFINKFILTAAAVAFAYGLLQAAGLDFMAWKYFFTRRIFSFLGNPNFFADFCVCALFVTAAAWFESKEKKYIALFAAGLACLFFTESKGAWLAFGGGAAFFSFALLLFYFPQVSGRKKILTAAAGGLILIAALALVAVFSAKRMQSVNFRLITWRGAVAAAADAPVLGHGSASFASVYPAYRRAQIFYIENMHNNETAHAENEYIEVLVETGLIGLTLFVFVIFYVFALAFKHMRAMPRSGRAPPQSWRLLGACAALAAMLIHNFFDISMRLPAFAFLFALFISYILVLCRPYELPFEMKERKSPFAARGLRFIAVAVMAGLFIFILYGFKTVGGSFADYYGFGDKFMLVAVWGLFIAVFAGALYIYNSVLKNYARPGVYIVMFLGALLTLLAWNHMKTDYYLSLANYYNKHGMYGESLKAYARMINLSPYRAEFYRSMGNALMLRGGHTPSFNPHEGDMRGYNSFAEKLKMFLFDTDPAGGYTEKKFAPLYHTDYSRAAALMLRAREISVNEAALNQGLGEAYHAMAKELMRQSFTAASQEEAEEKAYMSLHNIKEAQKYLEYSLLLDPVNQSTYFLLADAEYMQGNGRAAEEWLELYLKGPGTVKEEEYLARHRNNRVAIDLLESIRKNNAVYRNTK